MKRPADTADATSLVGTRFAATSLIDGAGTGCFLAGSALFFTRELGLSAGEVGLGLAMSGLIGFATSVPWGRAADRLGARQILVTLLALRAVGFLLYAFAGSFAGFLLIVMLLGLVEKASAPVQQMFIGETMGEERRQRALAVVRTTRNVGFAIGAAAATAVVSSAGGIGYDAIVLFNAATFVVAAGLMGSIRGPRRSESPAHRRGLPATSVRDTRYLRLTVLNGILTLHMSLLSVGLPLWLVMYTDVPTAAVPLLLLVNTVLTVVLQVPVADRVRSARGAGVALAASGLGLAACCLAMPVVAATSGGAALAAVGFAVLALTLAEVAQSAGGWDLSFRLAPESRRGHYLAVFSLGMTAQMIVGPLLLTTVVFALGSWGWAMLAAVVLGAGAGVRAVVHAPPAAAGAAAPVDAAEVRAA